jgi:hypothetical protein
MRRLVDQIVLAPVDQNGCVPLRRRNAGVVSLADIGPGWRPTGAATPSAIDASNSINTYCSGCHNGRMRSPSGILLDQFDTARISESPDTWSRAYRQLQAGTMPPVGAPRPDRATSATVLTFIEQTLAASGKPEAAPTARRLPLVSWRSYGTAHPMPHSFKRRSETS